MADYDCEWCEYDRKCKYAYDSNSCEFRAIESYKKDLDKIECLRSRMCELTSSLNQIKLYDTLEVFEEDVAQIKFIINLMNSKIDKETQDEYFEMIKEN